MTRHNDETHPLSTAHEARTGHNDAHAPRFRWSDEAHTEAHTRHTPTRHNGQHPFRGAPCRLSSLIGNSAVFLARSPRGLRREFSPRVAELGGSP
jgi:hypothetical protein